MSELIDKLNQVLQSAPQAMGFRTAKPVSSKPKMVLIARLTEADADNLADYVAGADGVLLYISQGPTAKTLKKVSHAMSEIPWGWWLDGGSQGKIKQIVKAGCDFIAFPAAGTSPAIPRDNKLGRILQVDASISEGLLRTASDLPVDAVLVAGEQEAEHPLTWHHLMLFRRFASLLTKPLLVSIPSNTTPEELQAIWDTGVNGVITEIEAGQPPGRLNELRQAIDKLTPRSSRKEGKLEALLPHVTKETEPAADIEIEEEDEE